MELTERQALLVLNALPRIGPIALSRLLEAFGGDPRAVLASDARRLERVKGIDPGLSRTIRGWRGHFDPVREEASIAAGGMDVLIRSDGAYPAPLREIHDPPPVLYRRGGYGFDATAIAVVGSRRPTPYGLGVARSLAAELARRGCCVVSGLARGIDTAAHEGALEAGGRTVAVLGGGLGAVYPPENLPLALRIAGSGAVVSEYPLGRRPDRQTFPRRNRIVAGMSAAVIVVESGLDGGAMITARLAGDQGRLVFAVPGRIGEPSSEGCHQLIRDGATLLTGIADVWQELDSLGGFRMPPLAPRPGAVSEGSRG
jgi:DNA processing protein